MRNTERCRGCRLSGGRVAFAVQRKDGLSYTYNQYGHWESDENGVNHQSMRAIMGAAVAANAGTGLRYPSGPYNVGFGHQCMYWIKMHDRAIQRLSVSGWV